jgi:D-beta-D-heptose 7-phosphate kinase/D-beta-D-heptose 1-phosphate adenosyltransferase
MNDWDESLYNDTYLTKKPVIKNLFRETECFSVIECRKEDPMDIFDTLKPEDLLGVLELDKVYTPKILVIGDIMIDEYIYGDINQISPEAPVPIVDRKGLSRCLGGAGNVVNNLVSLGAKVTVCGCLGNDYNGDWVWKYLGESGVEDYTARIDGPTTLKQRVIAGGQHVLRLDNESPNTIDQYIEEIILKIIESIYKHHDIIVISDYNKGVITPNIARATIASGRNQVPVLIDPKGVEYEHYKGATILTPNFKEMQMLSGRVLNDKIDFYDACSEFMKKAELNSLLVTCGDSGMEYFERTTNGERNQINSTNINAVARQVFDITGAGDTVISTLAFFMAQKLPIYIATVLANIAAGIVVGKSGTSTTNLPEISCYIKRNM